MNNNNDISEHEAQAPPTGLAPKQQQAISALLAHPTARGAAEVLGVHPATIWRWLQNPEFRQAYDEARRLVAAHNITALHVAGQEAVMCLLDLANSQQTPDNVRVKAAQVILDLGMEAARLDELERRIRAVEAAGEEY